MSKKSGVVSKSFAVSLDGLSTSSAETVRRLASVRIPVGQFFDVAALLVLCEHRSRRAAGIH